MDKKKIVNILTNNSVFYVLDKTSKDIFRKDLGLPFDTFTSSQKDVVSALLKHRKIGVSVKASLPTFVPEVAVILSAWKEEQPFKTPIKKKYSLSFEEGKLIFSHLGPTAPTLEKKAAAVSKCQASITSTILRVCDIIEPHFYSVNIMFPTVDVTKHKSGGSQIDFTYTISFKPNVVSEDSDEGEDDE